MKVQSTHVKQPGSAKALLDKQKLAMGEHRPLNQNSSELYWIVMGDVISSSKYEQSKLQAEFDELIVLANTEIESDLLSPCTITLGDEFQGLVSSLFSAVKIVDLIDLSRLEKGFDFKIRFVVYQGAVDTAINSGVAHGMLGPGLTAARSILNDKRRNQHRIRFRMNDKVTARNLELLWLNRDGIINKWNKKDYPLVMNMMCCDSDVEIAKMFNKNTSQIWKRRKSLKVRELEGIREVIFSLATSHR